MSTDAGNPRDLTEEELAAVREYARDFYERVRENRVASAREYGFASGVFAMVFAGWVCVGFLFGWLNSPAGKGVFPHEAVNSLFSALAFGGVIYALVSQVREARAARDQAIFDRDERLELELMSIQATAAMGSAIHNWMVLRDNVAEADREAEGRQLPEHDEEARRLGERAARMSAYLTLIAESRQRRIYAIRVGRHATGRGPTD